jgi:hypothetical protein
MLRAFITGVLARDHQPDALCSCWPGGERTWITAVNYDTGRPAVFGRPGTPRVASRGVLTRAERFVRRRMTGALLREVEQLRAAGTQVTVLTPGPDGLAAMGGNLMDGRRRLSVLETSLRTCPAASITMA